MSTFEYLGTLEQYLHNYQVKYFSWSEDDLENPSIPLYITTTDEVQIRITCSKELSDEIRNFDGSNGYRFNPVGRFIEVQKETLELNERIVQKVKDHKRKYIRLTVLRRGLIV